MSSETNGMNTKIFIPTPLRPYAGRQDAVEVHASTVGDALAKLTARHPDLKRHLYTEDGKLRAFVNVYLNDEDVRYLSHKEHTPVKDGDHVSIIPSIAGGQNETDCRLSAVGQQRFP
jgi:adenylyltransferase/sulfurtransferase